MELTVFAAWLNDVFLGFDVAILGFYHSLAESAGTVLTPIAVVVSYTAYKGLPLILASLVLIVFPKTRRLGICTLLALAIGATFTNLIVKVAVARPRPYNLEGEIGDQLRIWWQYVGSWTESDYCFPSGHMTAACAFSTGFILTKGKKYLPYGVIYVILMGASRNYLVVHYPSDVIGGFVFGTVAGIASFYIVRAVYKRWGDTKFLRLGQH